MIRPDFREIKHSELYHYGVSKRNGAPGPGSGRYPLGSGSEPFQGIESDFYRVGTMKPNASGVLYVSSDKDDAQRYIKNLGPTTLGKLLGTASDKFQNIKINYPMKAAPEDDTIKIINETLKRNPEVLKTFNDSVFSYLLLNDSKEMPKDQIDKLDSKDSKNLAISVMAMFGDGKYSNEAKVFYDEFRKNGFDMIPDLYDRNTGTSKTASIILSPDKIKSIGQYTLTKDDIKRAKEYLKTVEKLSESEYV